MARARTRSGRRLVRHARVRRKVVGAAERPRLAVFRSLGHIYAQIIDDAQGETLVAGSSLDGEIRAGKNGKSKTDVAKLVGGIVGKRASEAGITAVVFDRGGYKYHGRVKALADGAREGGLVF